MKNFKQKALDGFNYPTKLPESKKEADKWQKQNYLWWQNNPMRYDWKEKIWFAEFTEGFYKEIDKRFFSNVEEYLPSRKKPFDLLIDFESLSKMDVLEIGVGNGSHAQLLAGSAKSFTGIDITDYAVKSAKKRFEIFNLPGQIIKMDAEALKFKDNSFDFVWSWGVIHHSANTKKILEEIHRILRPNGIAVIMVYHRGWWNYYITVIIRSLFDGVFFKRSIAENMQLYTDGALARYYTLAEWACLAGTFFKVEKIEIMGPKTDIVLLPSGKLKSFLISIIPLALNKFLTRRIKMGTFLISRICKENNK